MLDSEALPTHTAHNRMAREEAHRAQPRGHPMLRREEGSPSDALDAKEGTALDTGEDA